MKTAVVEYNHFTFLFTHDGFSSIFIPHPMIVARYYGSMLDVLVSVHRSYICPSLFRFLMITWVNIEWFSPNLVCALILWRSGLGLLMGKFRQILTELHSAAVFCPRHAHTFVPSVFISAYQAPSVERSSLKEFVPCRYLLRPSLNDLIRALVMCIN